MKKVLIVLLGLIICSGFTFALDQGEIEIGTGVGIYKTTKVWDIDGNSTDVPDPLDPTITMIPFGITYGISDNLDASFKAAYVKFNEDWFGTELTGIGRPSIGIKYMSEMDLGASLDIWLPLGSEDIVGTDPQVELDIAVLYEPTFGSIDLAAGISYNLTFEDDFGEKQDAILISAEPTYKAMEGFGVSLGLDYLIVFDYKVDGTAVTDTGGSLFTVTPGANYDLNDMANLALGIPIDLVGKNAYSGWGIELELTLSF